MSYPLPPWPAVGWPKTNINPVPGGSESFFLADAEANFISSSILASNAAIQDLSGTAARLTSSQLTPDGGVLSLVGSVDVTGVITLNNGFTTARFEVENAYVKLTPPNSPNSSVGLYISGTQADTRLTVDNDNQVAGLEVYERTAGGQPGVALFGMQNSSNVYLRVYDAGNADTYSSLVMQGSGSAVPQNTFEIASGQDKNNAAANAASIRNSGELQINAAGFLSMSSDSEVIFRLGTEDRIVINASNTAFYDDSDYGSGANTSLLLYGGRRYSTTPGGIGDGTRIKFLANDSLGQPQDFGVIESHIIDNTPGNIAGVLSLHVATSGNDAYSGSRFRVIPDGIELKRSIPAGNDTVFSISHSGTVDTNIVSSGNITFIPDEVSSGYVAVSSSLVETRITTDNDNILAGIEISSSAPSIPTGINITTLRDLAAVRFYNYDDSSTAYHATQMNGMSSTLSFGAAQDATFAYAPNECVIKAAATSGGIFTITSDNSLRLTANSEVTASCGVAIKLSAPLVKVTGTLDITGTTNISGVLVISSSLSGILDNIISVSADGGGPGGKFTVSSYGFVYGSGGLGTDTTFIEVGGNYTDEVLYTVSNNKSLEFHGDPGNTANSASIILDSDVAITTAAITSFRVQGVEKARVTAVGGFSGTSGTFTAPVTVSSSLEITGTAATTLYLHSPNGSRWALTVDNAGIISTTAA